MRKILGLRTRLFSPSIIQNVKGKSVKRICCFFPAVKELDAKMLLKLSKKLNKMMDILTLGTIGLGMKEEVIEGQLKDNESEINMAALGMLKMWMRSQPDGKIAYRKLCEALRNPDVNMEFLIKDTLY